MTDDLISRQAAIDAVGINTWAGQRLLKVPSAQPNLQPTCNKLATDCISRQAAIDAVFNNAEHPDKAYGAIRHLPSAQPERREEAIIDPVDLVRNLADRIGIHQLYAIAWDLRGEPAQRTGRWIGGELGYCSCCGHEGCASDIWSGCKKDHMFCPNCGAQMEVEE